MKTNGLMQYSVMTQLKNKLRRRDRIDFFKKMGHGRNVNIRFIDNICEYVMIYSKNSLQTKPYRYDDPLSYPIAVSCPWNEAPVLDRLQGGLV